jgi:hypothetical protein
MPVKKYHMPKTHFFDTPSKTDELCIRNTQTKTPQGKNATMREYRMRPLKKTNENHNETKET